MKTMKIMAIFRREDMVFGANYVVEVNQPSRPLTVQGGQMMVSDCFFVAFSLGNISLYLFNCSNMWQTYSV